MRGCINCDASKEYKKRHGGDYGFDHQIIIGCLVIGCKDYGYTLASPFLDPEEAIRLAKKYKLDKRKLEKVKEYLNQIKEEFGEYYKKMGVSLEKLIKNI